MNNVLTALCGTVNFMPPWIMLGVFGAIILLTVLIIVLKGVKRKFFRVLIYILVGLIPASYLVYLCVQIAMWDNVIEIIAFAIGWGPTILFTLGIIIAVLRGIRRGLRKSLILALHAACAGVVCIAFFFIMVYVKEVDAGVLKFVNWLGGENAVQHLFGVSEDCSTLKEVLAAYIVTIPGVGFGSLSPYVYTLVDMAYRIIFGILSCLLFFAIDFILYIVYVLCYSQRKYKKNRTLEFQNGKTDKNYKKHWIGGGVVGLVRGVATGLLCLSFLGSAFFVVAGGKGEGKLEDHDFGNDDLNFYYQIYRSIESYGAQGIFKILNAMSDAADTPYYLFAADLVFSGELNDEEFGISENVKFREELGAFTGFARDTFNLLIKYGPDEIDAIVNGEVTDGAFDTVVEIMTRAGFRQEFDSLIDAFDAQTYIINLSMAFVNTVVSNIDEIEFTKDAVGEGEKELIKLIFKKGFLTNNIPDERDLITATGVNVAEGSDIRPYLTVNHILNKNDVKLVLNVVLSLLAGEETGDTLQLVKRIVPEMGKLSILGTGRKDEVNPILGRMYCLFENLYLTADGEDGMSYSEVCEEGIDWIGEIHQLFAAVDDTLVIYNNVSEADLGEEAGALDILKYLFDEKNAKFKQNMDAYDNVCTLLTESDVLGRALATNFVFKTVKEALTGLSPNVYLPEGIVYKNTVDKNGNKVYGETYQLLYGVKLLFGGDNATLLDNLMGADSSSIKDVLDALSAAVAPDEDGNTNPLINHLTDSVILRSVISIELIEVEGNTFYVPKAALEEPDGEPVNLITKGELKGLLENMDMLVEYVMFFDGTSTEWEDEIDNYLIKNDKFYGLVRENRIFEGTVASLFTAKLGSNSLITVPKALDTSGDNRENLEGWITINNRDGELLALLDALRKTNFSIKDIILGSADNEENNFGSTNVLKKISSMSDGELEDFFSSKVLHYTVSGYVLDEKTTVGSDFKLVVPFSCRQALQGDSLDYLVRKSELVSLLKGIGALGLYDGEEESPDETPDEGEDNGGDDNGDGTDENEGEGDGNTDGDTDEGNGDTDETTDETTDKNNGEDNEGGTDENEGEDNGEGDGTEEPEEPDEGDGTDDKPANKSTIDKVLVAIVNKKWIYEDSKIISASIVSTIVNNEKWAKETLAIPRLYNNENMGSEDRLLYYDSTNSWTKELPALIEALDELFGLGDEKKSENFSIDTIDVSATVSGVLLNLNGPSDVDGRNEDVTTPRTKLRVLYDSVIFRGKMTAEVDRAFAGEVDAAVISHVKNEGNYTFEELQNLSNAANEIGTDSFENFNEFKFNEFDFTEQSNIGEGTKLHVIYRSYIARGVITKNVKETVIGKDSYVVDHPKAFESETLQVYRESEIEALVTVFGKFDKANDVDVVNIASHGHYFYDNGETKSYILVASATEKLLNWEMFVVPNTVYDDKNGYIKPQELRLFMDSLQALLNDPNNPDLKEVGSANWTDKTEIYIPAQESRNAIFESVIMRAKITNRLLQLNQGSALYIQEANCDIVDDIRKVEGGGERRTIISKAQLKCFVAALESYGGNGNKFEMKLELDRILSICKNEHETLSTMFESDIIRYRICELLQDNKVMTFEDRDTVVNLRYPDDEGVTVSTADAKDVINVISALTSDNG